MTPPNDLEVQGNFFTHPFAELVSEITRARLTGSLRAADKAKKKKWVIYFRGGDIVFAVSNARTSRLFDILLRQGRIAKGELVTVPNYANDFELAAYLQAKGIFEKPAIDEIFVRQIEEIIVDACTWTDSDWTFSSLMRVRDGLEFDVKGRELLVDFVRCLPQNLVLGRFRSMDEAFTRSAIKLEGIVLTPEEEMVMDLLGDEPITASQIIANSGLGEGVVLRAVYALWIAGLLKRFDWKHAFTDAQVAAMNGAKLEIKREARVHAAIAASAVDEEQAESSGPESPSIMTVEQYLDQVEGASTFYDMLGVDHKDEYDEIKRAYFFLARNFHPDRYHAGGGEIFKRVQRAFTEIAQAHETLKHADQREMYDYRMRKQLAEKQKASETGSDERDVMNKERAIDNFETGFSLLMDGNAEEALPYLARAAHFDPKNARFRGYFGQALASDPSQRHKAEAEIQAAVRLDPNNPTFRLVLAEFFINYNLLKRAEGELNRLLAVFPSNRDAQEMLAKLKK